MMMRRNKIRWRRRRWNIKTKRKVEFGFKNFDMNWIESVEKKKGL